MVEDRRLKPPLGVMLHAAFTPVAHPGPRNTQDEATMATRAAFQTIDSRRAPRDAVSFRALVAGTNGVAGLVLLVDLSPFGFMARGTLPLAAGDVVTVRLPVVGDCTAIVRWSLAGRLGGEFAETIPAHGYARMLAAAPHDRPSWNEV